MSSAAPEHQEDPSDGRTPAGQRGGGRGAWICAALLGLVLTACVIGPIAWAIGGSIGDLEAGAGLGGALSLSAADSRSLLRSAGYAALIAAIALLLAWPAARTIAAGGRSGRLLGVVSFAAMLIPPYLAYAGWTLLRAPGTLIGDAAFEAARDPSFLWVPTAIGRACAVLGLACWVWPIAALALARSMRTRLGLVDEQLAIDLGPGVRSLVVRIRTLAGPIAWSAGLIFVVMLGSAIPLHVAQADTFALRLWLRLDQAPAGGASLIWLGGWPLWLPGLIAGVFAARAASAALAGGETPPPVDAQCGRLTAGAAWMIWGVSVLVPNGLFAMELFADGWGSGVRVVARFVQAADQELLATAWTLPIFLVLGACVCCCASTLALAGRHSALWRWFTATLVGVCCVSALVPGVLIGSAAARVGSASWLGWMSDGPWLLVMTVTARWCVVPMMAGVLMAASEPAAVQQLRRIDAGLGVRGLWQTWWRPGLGGFVAAGVLFALLGAHEIEAAVQVASPGWPSLPRKLLNLLHFARDDDLSAAVVLISVPVLASAMLVAAFAGGRTASGGRADSR